MNRVSEVTLTLPGISGYLCSALDSDPNYWAALGEIAPDYSVLVDCVSTYFFDRKLTEEEEENLRRNTNGRKLKIRDKHIIISYTLVPEMEEIMNDNPFALYLNKEQEGPIDSLIINYNKLVKDIIQGNYIEIFKFFTTIFAFVQGKDDPRIQTHALYAYIDFMFIQIGLMKKDERYRNFVDYSLDEVTDPIQAIALDKFKVSNDFLLFQLIIDYLENGKIDELFYSPKALANIIYQSQVPLFNLKGLVATIRDCFETQEYNLRELRDTFVEISKMDQTRASLNLLGERFEPLQMQLELLDQFDSGKVNEIVSILHIEIKTAIEKYGIQELTKPEETEEDKLRARIQRALQEDKE